MKSVHRLIGLFRDSPTYGRDRVNLISGTTIGTTALILNGVVMMLVLPLMLDPNDRDFRSLTENVGFGQLLALILLGGATACATLVIPLRLVTVFWGPRTGRYFDQIVLSGISPLRFVIGKAMSQNLFLLLVLFLLLPWLVLSLSLGGVHPGVFLAGLLLVWLYCIALALATLWVSLYLNELLSAVLVIFVTVVMSILGLIPMPFQPFVLTPFPALIYPVYASIPSVVSYIPDSYATVFVSCAGCLTAVIGVSLFAIYLGPLYGIIPENSTFGEVVRKGDSKRKRRFRLRLHIQRPSEIAFFYENRGGTLRPHEGLIRWGGGFLLLLLPVLLIWGGLLTYVPSSLASRGATGYQWWIYEFHAFNLFIHGTALAAAIFLFSHARNSTYQRQAVVFGKTMEVSRLDSSSFLVFWLLSTLVSIAVPFYADQIYMAPAGGSLFPPLMYGSEGRPMDYIRTAIEGSLVVSVAGLTLYVVHRLLCLNVWMKTVSFAVVGSVYFFLICVLPLMCAIVLSDVPELRNARVLGMDASKELAPVIGMVSPMVVMLVLFGETAGDFPEQATTLPFYVVHGGLLLVATIGLSYVGRALRRTYSAEPEVA